MMRIALLTCFAVLMFSPVVVLGQDVAERSPELVASDPHEDLLSPTSVAISPDGKFLYASAYNSATHVVFRRDEESGTLEHVQTIEDAEHLDGATALRLSADGKLAAAAAFRSASVVLYARDEQTGELTKLDAQQDGIGGVTGLNFAIEARISPDNRFVYVLDANGAVTCFRISGKGSERKLEFVESRQSEELRGARGLAFHPSGNVMIVACELAGTLALLKRDETSGKTEIAQVLRNGEGEIEGLAGVFGVAMHDEGRFVYTVSGRFRGDSAIGVYRYDATHGKLSLVQEMMAARGTNTENEGRLTGFQGGNEIAVSADGSVVCSVASNSNALAVLSRDAKSGELKVQSVLSGKDELSIASGVAISGDSRFIYVAAEGRNAVSIYRLPAVGEDR